MNHLIISFICPDRPGLVEILSQLVKTHQGNWQTSSLHHLSGFFTGVVEVAITNENSDKLINALKSLPDFKCNIETASSQTKTAADVVLELTANDRVGIIQEISTVIHHQGGNLIKLVSTQESAPHSGQDLFKAKATICVENATIEQLIIALEALADDLMVDITR